MSRAPDDDTLAFPAIGARMPLIDIQHLTKNYGDVRAVDDMTFGVESGAITAFLGPNGSGKTTTLRSLLGLVTPTSGTATIDGSPYAALTDPLHVVGAMLEATAHPARTARGNLRLLATEAGVSASRVSELLRLVELDGAADRRTGGFSLGMRQRLGLAGALIGDPRVLVLDEPANGLDPEGIRWLRDFLRSLAGEGRTILLSSHVLSEVAQTVDNVVVIADGRLVVHAPLADLTNGTRDRVRVQSSAAVELADALRGEGMEVVGHEGDELVVAGASPDAIARLAMQRGVVVYGLTAESDSLEDVFLDLTSTPVEETV
jgi:ABC-2 type transport system ATP-binding protein